MGWENVPICDEHWIEEEGTRSPHRLAISARDERERCYRCGRRTAGIYVRRNIPDAAGRIDVACARCGKQVNEADGRKAAVVLLGMTYDDLSICIAFHSDCIKEVEMIRVPPHEGRSLIDEIAENERVAVFDQDAGYAGSQPDRLEDA